MGKALKVDTNLDKNLVVKSGQTIFRKILQEFEECAYQKRHSSTLLKGSSKVFLNTFEHSKVKIFAQKISFGEIVGQN